VSVNRITPALPPTSMQTFAVQAPLTSKRHWRKATCHEVNCRHWREGWATVLDESITKQHGVAQYIRNFSGRRFRETRADDGRTLFTFAAGQTCFNSDSHTMRDQDVPPIYLARGGDWRIDRDVRTTVHSGPDPWLDHLHSNLERVVSRLEIGE